MSRSKEHDDRNATYRKNFGDREVVKSMIPPTAQTIESETKKRNIPWKAEAVPGSQGATIHWLGDGSAKRVILYFHGGGFGLSCFDGHVIFLYECAERLTAAGKDTVVAFLEYGLTPKVKYPTQLLQATEALRLILGKGYKPSQIVVGGDSAGGNLSVALASSLLHPHPSIPPLKVEEPIAGLLLISAWVSFEDDAKSFDENEFKDMHARPAMKGWAQDYALPEERDNYSEPMRADSSWWKNLPAKQTLNVIGDYEMFRDDLAEFGKTLKQAGVDVIDVHCPMQVHIDCILDAATGMEPGPMSKEIWKWLPTVF